MSYAGNELWGRKLLFIVSAGEHYEPPLLYFDSDVLFFAGARSLWPRLSGLTRPAYMEEPNREAFDDRWDAGTESLASAGFLYFPAPLDWKRAVQSNARLLDAPASGWSRPW